MNKNITTFYKRGMWHANVSLFEYCTVGCDECGVTLSLREFEKKNLGTKPLLLDLSPELKNIIDENSITKIELSFFKDGDPVLVNAEHFLSYLNTLRKLNAIKTINISSTLASFSRRSVSWLKSFSSKFDAKQHPITFSFSVAEINGKPRFNADIFEQNIRTLHSIGVSDLRLRLFKHCSGWPTNDDMRSFNNAVEKFNLKLKFNDNNMFNIESDLVNTNQTDCGRFY